MRIDGEKLKKARMLRGLTGFAHSVTKCIGVATSTKHALQSASFSAAT